MNPNEIEAILFITIFEVATCSQTAKGTEISPHQCWTGKAGACKTLLGNMVFPTSLACQFTNHSQGVGQLQNHNAQVVTKFDDCSVQGLTDANIASTIFHNTWSVKVHGSKQDNACMAVLTSNEKHELLHSERGDGCASSSAQIYDNGMGKCPLSNAAHLASTVVFRHANHTSSSAKQDYTRQHQMHLHQSMPICQ